MTLHSDNIRFMRIFAGVPWKGGVIQQWGNRKRVFSRFRTLRLRHHRKWGQHIIITLLYNIIIIVLFSPLSPFHWHQNLWPLMTLNGFKGHFTLHVHYYERPLTNYLLLIYCSLFITRVTNAWPTGKCGKRSTATVIRTAAEYLESAENLRILRGCYIVRTLTNNTNIII